MERHRKLVVPVLTFVFALLLAFVVNPSVGLLGFMMAGDPTSNPPPCEIKIFRDLPYFTKPLDDWPAQGAFPRSPKYVFGIDRPITIEVHLISAKTTIVVTVTNLSLAGSGLPATINVECDIYQPGIYRSRVEEEVLYLSDHTEDRADGDFIHVREEDVLSFQVTDPPNFPDCRTDVMVDRGEAAATTTIDSTQPAMAAGFRSAANTFVTGCQSFNPDTTFWFNVGLALDSRAMAPFIRNAGADDKANPASPNLEADILLLGAHSYYDGGLRGHAPRLVVPLEQFEPDEGQIFLKPGFPADSDQGTTPQRFFYDPSARTADPTWGNGNGGMWSSDMDWAILYSCLSLSDDHAIDVGTIDAQGKFVKAPPPDNTTWAAKRWRRAFQGARGIHGICGYKSYGSGANIIKGVMQKWLTNVRARMSIPDAWRKAVREGDPQGVPAVLYHARNWPDTIDSMQRDPAPGEIPTYWTSGMTSPSSKKKGLKEATKKPLINGTVPATGALLAPVAQGLGEVSVTGDPVSTLLNGSCQVFVSYPHPQSHQQTLAIKRSEVLRPGSIFTKNATGGYSFDHLTPYSAATPNSITEAQALTQVTQVLQANFTQVPILETQGVFQGEAQVAGQTDVILSRYEVVLEQRYNGLTVFDSDVYALLTPDGTVDACDVVFYQITPTGPKMSLIQAKTAVEVAAGDFLTKFPDSPCDVTLILPFFGMPVDKGAGVLEVKPVYAIQFSSGLAVYTVDAVTGQILKIDQ